MIPRGARLLAAWATRASLAIGVITTGASAVAVATLFVSTLSVSAVAQTAADSTKAAPPAAKRPCAASEFHQFDFWIGTWEVRTPDGKIAGTNRIEPILDGCVLQETWRGAKGLQGSSLNMYHPSTKRWHQTWMDQQGTLLLLDGTFRDGAMVLAGDAPSATKPGTSALQRITWTPASDGSVRQLWESSEDGGKSWVVVFDGRYTRIR